MDKPNALIPYRAPVRTVVEFSIHGEDLQTGGSSRMVEGGQAHRARQALARADIEGYQAEVSLSITIPGQIVALEIAGRADGLFERDGLCVVEEIKWTVAGAEPNEARPDHRAQAACYGHMLCVERGYEAVRLRVLYVDIGGRELACFEEEVGAEQLAQAFEALVVPYLASIEDRVAWRMRRDKGLRALTFPYKGYRRGQREFAANIYVAIRDKKRLLAQAPTGIGKTMAALFPALKALGEGLTGQLFYLTARSTGKQVALAALDQVRNEGTPLRVLELTAKEKCCPREGGMHCDPAACIYVQGYFLRIEDALRALREQGGAWRSEEVYRIACEHQVCPFECSLALCEIADVVICDYNYAFDPGARLQRIFPHKRDLTLLIDEAHHLAGRTRDMLSAELESSTLRAFRKEWRDVYGTKNEVYRAAAKLLRAMGALRKDMGTAEEATLEAPVLAEEARKFVQAAGQALDRRALPGRTLLDIFLLAQAYGACLERYDDTYTTLLHRRGKEVRVRQFCLDPAPYLQKTTTKLHGVVAFSATLSPLKGYARLLGMDGEGDGLLALPSPFPPERLCVVGRPVSTRWAHRGETVREVAEAVAAMVCARAGNYLCMFPSYAYMRSVQSVLEEENLLPHVRLLCQSGGMDEAAREDFLAQFMPGEGSLLGLTVMGGVFGEGIDLPGERLSGVAVVGVGLPQVGIEQEMLRAYYERVLGDGFAYAYRYPGLTRVLQAVGRVIRTERDIGVALLIDDRFFHAQVATLLPAHWQSVVPARNTQMVAAAFSAFWKSGND